MTGKIALYGALVGTAIAVTAAILPHFIGGAKGAKEMEDAVSDLSDAIDAYKDAIENASQPGADLLGDYGTNIATAREMLEMLRDIAQLDAMARLDSSFTKIQSQIGTTTDLMRVLMATALETPEFADAQMQETFKLTVAEAHELMAMLDQINAAKGPVEVEDSTRRLMGFFEQTYGSALNIPPALRDLVRATAGVNLEASTLSKLIGESEASAKRLAGIDIASAIAAASYEARQLALALGISLEKAREIAQVKRESPYSFGRDGMPIPGVGGAGLSFDGSNGDGYNRVDPYEPDPLTPQSPGTSPRPRARTIEAYDNFDATVESNAKKRNKRRVIRRMT